MSVNTQRGISPTVGPLNTWRRLRHAAFAAALALCQFFCALPAWAELLPSVPESFPDLIGSGGKFSALRWNATGVVHATNPVFPFNSSGVTIDSPVDRIRYTSDYKDTLGHPGFTQAVVAGTTNASVTIGGIAAFGTLRGSSTASLAGGPSEARASSTAEFFDLIQIHSADPDKPNFNFDINLASSGIIIGGAGAVVQLWVIDVRDHAPRAGELISGPLFLQAAYGSGDIRSVYFGSLSNVQADDRYWVYGRLSVFAGAAIDFFVGPEFTRTFSADFSNTVELFIDPSADSPGGIITSASGYDYRTPNAPAVPEPSVLIMLAGGLLTGLTRSWVRNRRRCQRRAGVGSPLSPAILPPR